MLSNISSPGSREFLGLVSNEGRVNSEVISPIFSKSSVLWNKVSISMWYYMEGWTSKTLYVVLQTSAEDKELFAVKQRQNRRWTYLRVKVPVISSFWVSQANIFLCFAFVSFVLFFVHFLVIKEAVIREMIFLLASRSYYEVKLMAAEEFLSMIFPWKLSVSVRITE